MTSAGNDIVSLNAINVARTKQPRFYSKILSDTEKALYHEAGFALVPFENFVWLLWSVKESAYKYLQRTDPGLIFHPVKFLVTQLRAPHDYTTPGFETAETEGTGFNNEPAFKGEITYGPYSLYSRSLIYRELIVSVVNGNDNFKNTCWGVKSINKADPGYQSAEVRTFLIDRLGKFFNADDILIDKTAEGFPVAIIKNEEMAIPVSLSHHDQWVAYSFQSDLIPLAAKAV